MLRDSHRALMHTDAALRSELKDLHQGIRPMPSTGRRTLRPAAVLPGLASIHHLIGQCESLAPRMRDDDELEDGAIVEQQAKAAAWGERVMSTQRGHVTNL